MIAEIDGIPVAHSISGDGPPVLLLHGWGADMRLLEPLAGRLAPLGYRVFMLDLPGFGATPAPSHPWSILDYTKLVLHFADHCALDHIYLFGHSFGGRLGLVLGADHPQRIIRMALANSAGVRSTPSHQAQFRLLMYRTALNALRRAGLTASADKLRSWYGDRYGSPDYRAVQGTMRETFVRVVNDDLLPYAARVQVPTLLFWGDRDTDTPLAQGRLLEKTIPDAGLVLWQGAGHYSYLDRLADTVRVMDHFFRQDS